MGSSEFDVVVIGGGIHGSGIARELALRNLSVLLVERKDFGAETTAWSTRLIHGGLRYLETREIGLVREALRERENLLKNASHLVKGRKIAIPIYRSSSRSKSLVRLGMLAYDALSFRKSLPRHQGLSKERGLSLLPSIDSHNLSGVAVYFDAQVEYAERLCLENMIAAQQHGAVVRNHCEVSGFAIVEQQLKRVHITDMYSGSEKVVGARLVVNAAGPWAETISRLSGIGESNLLSALKGSHAVFKVIKGAPNCLLHFESILDGRALIIVPWLGMYVVGSTEVEQNGDPRDAKIGIDELHYLIESVNGILPQASLTVDDVAFTYAGVRPLAFDSTGGGTKTSRRHRIIDHGSQEGPQRLNGLISLVGGKLTTYRSTAEEVAKYVVSKLQHSCLSIDTAKLQLPGGDHEEIAALPQTFPLWSMMEPTATSRLVNTYGSRLTCLTKLIDQDETLAEPIIGSGGILKAEVVHSFESEMAATLEDVVARRIMMTWTPSLGVDYVQAIGNFAADYFGWQQTRLEEELRNYFTHIGRFGPQY